MMTLIVLAALAGAWLLYFLVWLRESRSAPSQSESMHSFSRALGALARPGVELRSRMRTAGTGVRLVAPRTSQEAMARRRGVMATLVITALASLAAVPTLGVAALAMHVLADLAILAFVCTTALRRRSLAAGHSNVRVLHPRSATNGEAGGVVVPLRRAAEG